MCTETIETNGISEIVNLDVQLNSLIYTTPHVSKFCICSETKKVKMVYNGLWSSALDCNCVDELCTNMFNTKFIIIIIKNKKRMNESCPALVHTKDKLANLNCGIYHHVYISLIPLLSLCSVPGSG